MCRQCATRKDPKTAFVFCPFSKENQAVGANMTRFDLARHIGRRSMPLLATFKGGESKTHESRGRKPQSSIKCCRRSLALLTAIILIAGVPLASTASEDGGLGQQISSVVYSPEYKHATWGIAIADGSTGEMLYQLNAEKMFAPASTTKLFTVAAALDALGPDFKFTTPVYRTGELKRDGRLRGDLVLRAMGDPNLSGRADENGHLAYTNEDHIYAGFGDNATVTETDAIGGIDDLASQIAASGIRFAHDVLVDDRLFDHATGSGSGPQTLTPIVVNDNLIDLIVTPGSQAGSSAHVELRPATAYAQFDISVETTEAGGPTEVSVERVSARRYTVRGRIAAGHRPLLRIAEADDPTEFARTLLIERLRAHGVLIEKSIFTPMDRGDLPDIDRYQGLAVVARHVSPPFSEAVRVILKVSHNLHASMLPLIMASQKGGRTAEEGLRQEGAFLGRIGVEAGAVSFGGGAGGTRADFVTPHAALQLLMAMQKRPDFAVFHDSLPILGVDGTLSEAVAQDSPARGKVYAKTGTLVSYNPVDDDMLLTSKALAGYMTSASGRKLLIAIYVNNKTVKTPADIEQQGKTVGHLCEIIYSAL
jgi:D-alanyl-D-alanine carboxypeptidase/D-alanyl-D-alanine-endopeptidase (penicillin-binding protein 4)